MVKETNVESNGDSGDNALRLGDQQGHLPPLQMGKALNDWTGMGYQMIA